MANGALKRPSLAYSAPNDFGANTQMNAPLINVHSFPVERNKFGVSSVVALDHSRCPATIVWAVTGIVIDSFNRVLRGWPRTHVSVKQGEIKPPITNLNPPSTVIVPTREGSVFASLYHVRPNHVFRESPKAVCRESFRGQLLFKAPAGLDVSVRQVARSSARFFATITEAIPQIIRCSRIFNTLACKLSNNKPAKPEAIKVSKFLVRWGLARNDWGIFGMVAHIVLSRGRFLTGESAFAL